ncbi:MAG: hypothetical protein ACOX06_00500 [Candidatus Dojkabacteria bacterium]|jgi:hypothetical protein
METMPYSEEDKLEIQLSSVSLGNPNQEGGNIGAVAGLVQSALDKEKYTNIVVENALEAQRITQEHLGDKAEFGVSVLASSLNPSGIQGFLASVDYPYLVKFNKQFLNEKMQRVKGEGYRGLGLAVALGKEYAYALLQSHSEEDQMGSTLEAVQAMKDDVVKVRTCIETVSFEEEMKKIRQLTVKLKGLGKNVIWAIEPNKKIGDGTFVDFMTIYDNIKNNPKNASLKFGIDLDMGGLPKEEYKDMFRIMEALERQGKNNLPLFLSLSGKEYTEDTVRTHLPLGNNFDVNKQIGEWLKVRQFRGERIPAIVVESSPTENVLADYDNFLKSFKGGFN